VQLAYAWLHGSVSIDPSWGTTDLLNFQGRWFLVEAPMPAVLMLPVVALFGLHANQTRVGVIIAALAVAALDALLARTGASRAARNWTLALFALGTIFWWCAAVGALWMFESVVAVTFAIFALLECYGKRRPWLVALLLTGASLSRPPYALAMAPLLVWLLLSVPRGRRLAAFGSFAAGIVPLAALYVLYNELRWGTPFDLGYTLWYRQDVAGSPVGQPYGIEHLPYNLFSFFLLAPQFVPQAPWLQPTPAGIALTFTSPALAIACCAPRSRETIVLWSCAALAAIPALFYYVNGYNQMGMRHSLDFTPFLLPLIARGLPRAPAGLTVGLIAYSIAANAYEVAYWAAHRLDGPWPN